MIPRTRPVRRALAVGLAALLAAAVAPGIALTCTALAAMTGRRGAALAPPTGTLWSVDLTNWSG